MNALGVAQIMMEIADAKQEAQMMVESLRLVQTCSYNVVDAFGARRVWMASKVALDTGIDPNLIGEELTVTAWTPLVWTVKASHVRSVCNNPMEAKGFISSHLQIRQILEKVVFLVVPVRNGVLYCLSCELGLFTYSKWWVTQLQNYFISIDWYNSEIPAPPH